MAEQRHQAAFDLLHADERPGVGGPRAAEAADDRLIARQLHVAVGEHVQDPHEGTEPVHAGRGDERELQERVKAPDVHEFVLQHKAQRLLIGPVRRLRQQDHGPQHAERERRRDAV